jgi:hypothetical protein
MLPWFENVTKSVRNNEGDCHVGVGGGDGNNNELQGHGLTLSDYRYNV